MATRITPTACMAKFPSYNTEYVTQGRAEFIGHENFCRIKTASPAKKYSIVF